MDRDAARRQAARRAPKASPPEPTAAPNGFRLPAQWEPHEATWMAWPHHRTDWPGRLTAVGWAFAEIIGHLTRGETVRLVVSDAAEQRRARRRLEAAGVDLARVEFFHAPTDRAWIRDSGPCFVETRNAGSEPALAVAGFGFNGWGRFPGHARDARLARRLAGALALPWIPATWAGWRLILEGGAIEPNGRGTLIATEECLLDGDAQPRNPATDRRELEAALATMLGARNLLWLARGLEGDDTHGHVDGVCRFVGPKRLLYARQPDRRDPDHRRLEANRERLAAARLEDGSRPELIALPMPEPRYWKGARLPASYANFYIGNEAVLVPTFNDPADRRALGLLADVFPDRRVLGVHAADLIVGGGAIHCLTREQPAVGRARESRRLER